MRHRCWLGPLLLGIVIHSAVGPTAQAQAEPDRYKSPQCVVFSPDGQLDESATRGERVFQLAGCHLCHPAPLYSNLKSFDVDTVGPRDFAEKMAFDTPSLRELYRSGPYLHDGRTATLEEVLTMFNQDDFHGNTSKLTNQEMEDLVAFLMTL